MASPLGVSSPAPRPIFNPLGNNGLCSLAKILASSRVPAKSTFIMIAFIFSSSLEPEIKRRALRRRKLDVGLDVDNPHVPDAAVELAALFPVQASPEPGGRRQPPGRVRAQLRVEPLDCLPSARLVACIIAR